MEGVRRLQLRNTLYAYDALRDYRNVETYAFNATNTAVARSGVLLQRHDHEVIGNRLEANYHGTLAGRRSDWSAGLDFSVNRQTRFPTACPPPWRGTAPTTSPPSISSTSRA